MNQLNLNEVREIELNLLKRFKAYCEENDIRYFVSNGTLLGAVKYKGFIPWDDDIDVLVPREDYNRMVEDFEDSDQYRMFSFERNSEFFYPFAKFCDMTTRKEEFNMDNGVALGIDIDIFPLDSWNDDLGKAKCEVKKISKAMFRLGLTKMAKSDSINRIKRFIKSIFMMFYKVLGSKYFIKQIISFCKKTDGEKSGYLGCKSWCVYGEREIIPAHVFADTIEVEFEGDKFSAPAGYDVYLRSLYGDYEKDPPLEEQKTHHKYNAYRI